MRNTSAAEYIRQHASFRAVISRMSAPPNPRYEVWHGNWLCTFEVASIEQMTRITGTTASQLWVCTGAFPGARVPHRGDVISSLRAANGRLVKESLAIVEIFPIDVDEGIYQLVVGESGRRG